MLKAVKNNLYNRQPVILEGRRSAASDWHVWVADGAREVKNSCYTYAYLHMNWGWRGDWNDWYGFSDWTPDDDDFTAYKKAIIDIKR